MYYFQAGSDLFYSRPHWNNVPLRPGLGFQQVGVALQVCDMQWKEQKCGFPGRLPLPGVASSLWASVSLSVKWGKYLPSRVENKFKTGAQPNAQREASNLWVSLLSPALVLVLVLSLPLSQDMASWGINLKLGLFNPAPSE